MRRARRYSPPIPGGGRLPETYRSRLGVAGRPRAQTGPVPARFSTSTMLRIPRHQDLCGDGGDETNLCLARRDALEGSDQIQPRRLHVVRMERVVEPQRTAEQTSVRQRLDQALHGGRITGYGHRSLGNSARLAYPAVAGVE